MNQAERMQAAVLPTYWVLQGVDVEGTDTEDRLDRYYMLICQGATAPKYCPGMISRFEFRSAADGGF